MKNIFLFLFLAFATTSVYAQKSFIQVTSEPGIAVYLDGQLKGTTTEAYKGYIVQDVSAGTHVIKVVKEGYVPFEENITVKAGEVFSYKVKPFTRNSVYISEQGNSAVSETKVVLPKGRLTIQSVPIDIQITMPQVEGLKNVTKNKDSWTVNDISEGNYEIQFSYGGKTITKNVFILGSFTTTAFVNMLSGEVTIKDPFTEKKDKERTIDYFISLAASYGFKKGLTPSEFYAKNPEAAHLSNYGDGKGWYLLPAKVILKNSQFNKGPRLVVQSKGYVAAYDYCVASFPDMASAKQEAQAMAGKIKKEINPKYVGIEGYEGLTTFTVFENKFRVMINTNEVGKNKFEVIISFLDDNFEFNTF